MPPDGVGSPTAIPDPAHEGECVPGPDVEIPIAFAPGGQCSDACDPSATDDGCGECSSCDARLGGSIFGWDSVGFSVRIFDLEGRTDDLHPGICRANCTFDPTGTTNGGCDPGYTCDAASNTCIEACVSDVQCQVRLCPTRTHAALAAVDLPARCNRTAGRCEWTAPGAAALGSRCEHHTDCPSDVGFCLGGFCTTYQCNLVEPGAGTFVYPCDDDAVCVGAGGNDAAYCLQRCASTSDCPIGQSCRGDVIPSGDDVCWAWCDEDAHCRASERCDASGACEPFCDPTGAGLPDAVSCGADEACAPVPGEVHGFCRLLHRLCVMDPDCHGTQACERLDDDALGRCVDGCETDADCMGAAEECKIQPGSARGVCRAPGGGCVDDTQCLDAQRCDSTAGQLGTCIDR